MNDFLDGLDCSIPAWHKRRAGPEPGRTRTHTSVRESHSTKVLNRLGLVLAGLVGRRAGATTTHESSPPTIANLPPTSAARACRATWSLTEPSTLRCTEPSPRDPTTTTSDPSPSACSRICSDQ